jgi:hypothetical protein
MSLRDCLSGPDRLDRIEISAREQARELGRYDELVRDEQDRLTLKRAVVPLRAVSSMARWPGGIGEEPVFGEAG